MDDFTRIGSELVLTMARALVDHPEQITIEIQKGVHTTVFYLKMAPGELGQVLGKRAANALAMRKILYGFATKSKRRAVLEIVESASTQAFLKEAA